ncbi:hypothetical protein [Actinophytocola sp.]|jgi:hypothetical protein|uniref:hypothetical protein n=1 Tax=Actinophytocola sp. TaxID=1872138 RepID=UPI002EDAF0A9
MTDAPTSTTVVPEETGVAPAGPRATLTTLRVLAVLHALSVLAQPTFAGLYLSGDVDALGLHSLNSNLVAVLGLCQLVAAIVFGWRGRGRWWPLYASIAVLLAETLQTELGYVRMIAIHVPLGVSVVAGQILLTVWLFRADAARGRK